LLKNPISHEQILCEIFGSQVKELTEFDGMGLLDVEMIEARTGQFKHYQFRYKVIQEFLAAMYLTRFNVPNKIPNEVKELKSIFNDTNYEMVWIFYAGISKMSRVSIERVLPELISSVVESAISLPVKGHDELVDNWKICHNYYTQMKKSETFSVNFLLTLMVCCYEAKNSKACNIIADNFYPSNICRIEIPPNRATSYLLSAVTYFIACSGKKWSFRCDATIPNGVDILLNNIAIPNSSPVQLQNSDGLWVLCFVVTSSEVDKYIELIKKQPSLQWIHLLNGSWLGDEGTVKLCHFLATFSCSIIKVELESCSIGSIGLKEIASMLQINRNIVYVNLRKNLFKLQDVLDLLAKVTLGCLEYLILDEEYSEIPEITTILNKINAIRTDQKATLLHLNHYFLLKYKVYCYTPLQTEL